jgi:hypothetical protein
MSSGHVRAGEGGAQTGLQIPGSWLLLGCWQNMTRTHTRRRGGGASLSLLVPPPTLLPDIDLIRTRVRRTTRPCRPTRRWPWDTSPPKRWVPVKRGSVGHAECMQERSRTQNAERRMLLRQNGCCRMHFCALVCLVCNADGRVGHRWTNAGCLNNCWTVWRLRLRRLATIRSASACARSRPSPTRPTDLTRAGLR